mmetsp:Transcript_80315/g.239190  ORF Transcript_80315/g.239190 Transcript_80315/m.239190 type:complete len:201 (-) Transcript_80315:182-784(-)
MQSKAPRVLGARAETAGRAATRESSSARLLAIGMRTARCSAAWLAWKASSSFRALTCSSKALSMSAFSFAASFCLVSPLACASSAPLTAPLAATVASLASFRAVSLAATAPSLSLRVAFASSTLPSKPSFVAAAADSILSASSRLSCSLARTPSMTSPIQETSVTWCSWRSARGVLKMPGTAAASISRQESGRSLAWSRA